MLHGNTVTRDLQSRDYMTSFIFEIRLIQSRDIVFFVDDSELIVVGNNDQIRLPH